MLQGEKEANVKGSYVPKFLASEAMPMDRHRTQAATLP
jgi:hypothetical protein